MRISKIEILKNENIKKMEILKNLNLEKLDCWNWKLKKIKINKKLKKNWKNVINEAF